MRDLLQFFIAGVAAGAIYALVGLGLVIIYKATHVLNFAHGALMMVGAYLTYQLHAPRHPIQGPPGFAWPYWVAVPAAMALTGAVGFLIEVLVLRRMRGRPVFAIIMVTFGLTIVVEQLVTSKWGGDPVSMYDPFGAGILVRVSGVPITKIDFVTLVAAVAITGAFLVFFRFSRLGTAMRATAYDQEAAIAQGISAKKVFGVSWAISAAIATVAAVLAAGGPQTLSPNVQFIALAAFPAIILGGVDSTTGAIVGGLILGVVQQVCFGYEGREINLFGWHVVLQHYLGSNFHIVLPFVVMVVILMFRPYGFFGTKEVRRV